MTSTDHTAAARLTGLLLLTSLTSMIASAAIVVPTGLTLNPADPAATLAAVSAQPVLHLLELGLDVLGWLALTAAGLTWAAGALAGGTVVHGGPAVTHTSPLALLPAGLLTAAGLAGLLHDAGNLAVTQLAGQGSDPAIAGAVLLTAKWMVNMAGLLWVAAAASSTVCTPMPTWLRRTGVVVALCGLGAVVLPWTTGVDGPSAATEQAGYALHLPVMAWYAVLVGRIMARVRA